MNVQLHYYSALRTLRFVQLLGDPKPHFIALDLPPYLLRKIHLLSVERACSTVSRLRELTLTFNGLLSAMCKKNRLCTEKIALVQLQT